MARGGQAPRSWSAAAPAATSPTVSSPRRTSTADGRRRSAPSCAALPVPETIAFFTGLGVPLHEEPAGKLFPDSNRSRDVLDALLNELARLGGDVRVDHRVERGAGLSTTASRSTRRTARSAPAAWSSLPAACHCPKPAATVPASASHAGSGTPSSPTTPALAPLLLDDGASASAAISGVAAPVRLESADRRRRRDARSPDRCSGLTSGSAVPRRWTCRATGCAPELQGAPSEVTANLAPGRSFETLDAEWQTLARRQPRSLDPEQARDAPAGLTRDAGARAARNFVVSHPRGVSRVTTAARWCTRSWSWPLA